MIHDVTIPFRFDTSPIEAQIANIGEQEVAKIVDSVVRQGIAEALPRDYGYSPYGTDRSGKPKVNWRGYVDKYMDKWMERHAQEVVDEAALLMAMRGSRKKAWREVLEELKEERDAE
ncbi:MAG: hypothetical protein IJ092_10180 [Atopobiaceae bacterium]|nr:hypothetical protein [Atopobiaceae bacterium]